MIRPLGIEIKSFMQLRGYEINVGLTKNLETIKVMVLRISTRINHSKRGLFWTAKPLSQPTVLLAPPPPYLSRSPNSNLKKEGEKKIQAEVIFSVEFKEQRQFMPYLIRVCYQIAALRRNLRKGPAGLFVS